MYLGAKIIICIIFATEETNFFAIFFNFLLSLFVMKKISILLLLCSSIVFFASCRTDGPEVPPTTKPEDTLTHTLLIYMMGNNGLETFMDKNLSKILASFDKIPEHGRVAVFYDRGNYTRLSKLALSETGRVKQEMIAEWNSSNTSSVDPEFMSKVFALVKDNLPAETYGLIMSSHGGGWIPSDIFDLYIGGETTFGESDEPTAGRTFFGQDDFDCMEIPDLAQVLKNTDMDLDYILFDACFMASTEALYDLRETADYIVASSAEVLGDGFPYADMLPLLFKDNSHQLEAVCRKFTEYYQNTSGTISLIDCSRMDDLAASMKNLLSAAGSAKINVAGIQAYEGFPVHIYFDLEQYAEALTADKAMLEDFRFTLGKTVIYTGHSARFFSAYPKEAWHDLPRSCGLTCHIEQDSAPKTHAAFLETSWAKAIGSK